MFFSVPTRTAQGKDTVDVINIFHIRKVKRLSDDDDGTLGKCTFVMTDGESIVVNWNQEEALVYLATFMDDMICGTIDRAKQGNILEVLRALFKNNKTKGAE